MDSTAAVTYTGSGRWIQDCQHTDCGGWLCRWENCISPRSGPEGSPAYSCGTPGVWPEESCPASRSTLPHSTHLWNLCPWQAVSWQLASWSSAKQRPLTGQLLDPHISAWWPNVGSPWSPSPPSRSHGPFSPCWLPGQVRHLLVSFFGRLLETVGRQYQLVPEDYYYISQQNIYSQRAINSPSLIKFPFQSDLA